MLTPVSGELITPSNRSAPHAAQLTIRRRFQFSSALKRMSTVSSFPGGKTLAAVKGAPETIKTMLAVVPDHYDDTYKWFTRKGSRVLALGMKEMEPMSTDKVSIPNDPLFSIQTHYARFRLTNCPGNMWKASSFLRDSWYSIVLSNLMPSRRSRCLLIHRTEYVVSLLSQK